MELIAAQRVIASGSTDVSQVPSSPLNAQSPPSCTSSSTDLWVNGLWFTSLLFSLSTALLAVLVKQWLQAYTKYTFGTPQDQARSREFRFIALRRWHVLTIIGLLPILLHLSLFIFFIGLVVFLFNLNTIIGSVVAGVASAAYTMYFVTTLLPIWIPTCAYQIPFSYWAFVIMQHFRHWTPLAPLWVRLTPIFSWIRPLLKMVWLKARRSAGFLGTQIQTTLSLTLGKATQ